MMKTLFFYYSLILVLLLTAGAAYSAQASSIVPFLSFLPITLYFLLSLLTRMNKLTYEEVADHRFFVIFYKTLSLFGLYYGFVVVTVMSVSGLAGAKDIPQLISSVIFLPVVCYFILQVVPKQKGITNIPTVVEKPKEIKQTDVPGKKQDQQVTKLPKIDMDKRQFIKLIGAAGISIFFFSIFAKRAQAAFFGSVPGPGTVSIKDSSGTVIDPAISTPTDGYKITELDDSSPAYYGYLDKAGKWFIMKESSGAYRYTKGSSSFTTNWTNRASLTYDYFDSVF